MDGQCASGRVSRLQNAGGQARACSEDGRGIVRVFLSLRVFLLLQVVEQGQRTTTKQVSAELLRTPSLPVSLFGAHC